MKTCSKCGETYDDSREICLICENKLEVPGESKSEEEVIKEKEDYIKKAALSLSRKVKFGAIAYIGVLLVSFLVYFAFRFGYLSLDNITEAYWVLPILLIAAFPLSLLLFIYWVQNSVKLIRRYVGDQEYMVGIKIITFVSVLFFVIPSIFVVVVVSHLVRKELRIILDWQQRTAEEKHQEKEKMSKARKKGMLGVCQKCGTENIIKVTKMPSFLRMITKSFCGKCGAYLLGNPKKNLIIGTLQFIFGFFLLLGFLISTAFHYSYWTEISFLDLVILVICVFLIIKGTTKVGASVKALKK